MYHQFNENEFDEMGRKFAASSGFCWCYRAISHQKVANAQDLLRFSIGKKIISLGKKERGGGEGGKKEAKPTSLWMLENARA